MTRYPSTLEIQGGSGSGFSTDDNCQANVLQTAAAHNFSLERMLVVLFVTEGPPASTTKAAASRTRLSAAILTAAGLAVQHCSDW
jgi:hypothetical protein